MQITKLQKEVDVYCTWIDQAEEENRKQMSSGGAGSKGLGFTSSTAYGTKSNKPATESRVNAEEEDDEDDEDSSEEEQKQSFRPP